MQELDLNTELTLLKPEGTQHKGKPKLRWLESAEEDLKMGLRNWRRKAQDQKQWTVLKRLRFHEGL